MGRRNKPSIVGAVGSLVSGAWGLYANFTTATQLPSDATQFAKLLADPPVYLPWLAFVAFVGVLAWALWPREESPEDNSGIAASTSGHTSPAIGVNHGTVNIGPPNPAAIQPPRSPYGSGEPTRRYKTWDDLPVKREVCLSEALAYAITGQWGIRFIDALKDDLSNAAPVSQARQLAFDGLIKIWGKRTPSGVFEEIPSGYWADYQPEWFSLMRGTPFTERTSLSADYSRFIDLMASKADFEREWPTREKTAAPVKELPNMTVRDLLERVANERGIRDDGSIETLRKYREVARDMSDQFSLHGIAVWGRIDGKPLTRLDDESAKRGFGVGRISDGRLHCTMIHHNEDGVQVWIEYLHVRREEAEQIWPAISSQ